jgi:tRNA 5-methylaminomethyl-2-thiouridine biosynthesis bifunctional protein
MSQTHEKPWFDPPPALKDGSTIAIIGGGIGGLMMASHLSTFFDVTLIDKDRKMMGAASGNPIAILDPYITLGDSLEKEFYLSAFKYAVNYYEKLPKDIFNKCGLWKIPKNKDEQLKYSKICAKYPSSFMKEHKDGLFFPDAGYINPLALCTAFSDRFDTLFNTNIAQIHQVKNQKWRIFDDQGNETCEADAVILCNSYRSNRFEQSTHIELEKISGQISYVSTEKTINNVLCSVGYLTPPVATEHGAASICGATFEREILDEITEEAHLENIKNAPTPNESLKVLGGRREIRAMTNDHLPVCGSLPDITHYKKQYEGLHHGPTHKLFPKAPYHNGLYICTGLGARGFLTAPLLGAYMTGLIRDVKMHISEQIRHALHPARFLIRKISKK